MFCQPLPSKSQNEVGEGQCVLWQQGQGHGHARDSESTWQWHHNMPSKSCLNMTTCTCSLRNPLWNLCVDPYLCIVLFGQPWQQVANVWHPDIHGYPWPHIYIHSYLWVYIICGCSSRCDASMVVPKLVVSLNGEVLLEMVLTGALYYINQNANKVTFTTILGGSLHLWHRHMGHLHIDTICKLAWKEMVNEHTISSKNHDHVCKSCTLGKSHCLPFLKPTDTPQAPSPHIDRSRLNCSHIYRSSMQNANVTILRTCKVDNISLSILTIATPGDRGLSHL
jgi:hypothetical protein